MESGGIERDTRSPKSLHSATSDASGTLRGMDETASIPATRSSAPTCGNTALGAGFPPNPPASRTSRSTRHSTPRADTLTLGHVLLAFAVLLIIGLAFASSSEAASARRWCQRADLTPHQAIDCAFPARLRSAAKRVAECESTASAPKRIAQRRGLGRWARDYANGTHWGIFQLGENERENHGEYEVGDPAIVQVRSARSLHRARGWQPWLASRHCSGVR